MCQVGGMPKYSYGILAHNHVIVLIFMQNIRYGEKENGAYRFMKYLTHSNVFDADIALSSLSYLETWVKQDGGTNSWLVPMSISMM
jgi:hypothetical protein